MSNFFSQFHHHRKLLNFLLGHKGGQFAPESVASFTGIPIQKVIEKMLADYGIKMPSIMAIEKLGEIKMIESKINEHKILRAIEPSSEHKKMFSAVGISILPELAYVS